MLVLYSFVCFVAVAFGKTKLLPSNCLHNKGERWIYKKSMSNSLDDVYQSLYRTHEYIEAIKDINGTSNSPLGADQHMNSDLSHETLCFKMISLKYLITDIVKVPDEKCFGSSKRRSTLLISFNFVRYQNSIV